MQALIKDWRVIKSSLLIILVALFASILMLTSAYFYYAQHSQKHLTQAHLAQEATRKVVASGAEKKLIEKHFPQYQNLIKRGFVGEERRIEWVDVLRELQHSHQLFNIAFEISQQERYTPSFISQLGSFLMHRSIMKFELELLHEGDILEVGKALAMANTTPFLLRECTITRTHHVIQLERAANMQAKCALDWLTLREPSQMKDR